MSRIIFSSHGVRISKASSPLVDIPMIDLNKYLFKKYNTDTYNCAHFVADVWKDLTGTDIQEYLECFLKPKKERGVSMTLRKHFERLDQPQTPCIALLQRIKYAPHVGIYIGRRILHLHARGAQYADPEVVQIRYRTISYYGVVC